MNRLLWLLLLLIPGLALADPTSGGMFTPPTTDLSVGYLANIFGIVDGVLHGTGSQIMGAMFGVFNSAVLTLGSIIIMYTLMVSTLNTAHEGELMGRNWSSIWIPVRSVAGFALILPKATGYSFIQIFMMWVIVQGIGAADTVWSAALNYLEQGGMLVQPSASSSELKIDQLIAGNGAAATGALKSQICMYGVYNALTNNNPGSPIMSFTSSVQAYGNNNTDESPPCYNPPCTYISASTGRTKTTSTRDTGGIIYFPGYVSVNGQQFKGLCGNISWRFAIPSSMNEENFDGPDARTVAVNQIVLDTQSIAQLVANIIVPTANSSSSNSVRNSLTSSANGLIYAGTDYMGIMLPYLNSESAAHDSEKTEFIQKAEAQGWILAGSYYWNLSQFANSIENQAEETAYPTPSFSPSFTQGPLSTLGQYSITLSNYLTSLPMNCPTSSNNSINQYICSEYSTASSDKNNNQFSGGGGDFNDGDSDIASTMNHFTGTLSSSLRGMNDLLKAQQDNTDPIIAISKLGNSLVNAVEAVWITGTILVFTTSLIASIMTCVQPAGIALLTSLSWFIPMMTAVLFSLFVAGATMAYYVPLIPFIIFVSTAIGWFITVIETMVAAPLVGLGIAHPEGEHQVLGKAGPAVMLITSVFMGPSLMIIGFIAGAVLSHVALWFLNQGMINVMPHQPHDWMRLMSSVAIIVIYVGIVLSIINRSFGLIYELPNKVLRWIGGAHEMYGKGETEQAASQHMQGGASGAKGAMEGAGGSAKGGGSEMGSGIKGAKEEKKKQAAAKAGQPSVGVK